VTRGSTTADGSRPVALRQSGAVLVPVTVWVFCAFVAVLSVIEDGSVTDSVRTFLVMASVAFLAWMFLSSPCLVIESDGLRVVNPLRSHWVPFAALDDVRVRGLTTLVVRTARGGRARITSWNGPGVPRAFTTAAPPVARAIEQRRDSWERAGRVDPDATPLTTWRWRPLLGLLVVVVCQVTIWWQ
jgi:hypothetical protein